MPPLPSSSFGTSPRRRGVALEQCVLGLGVERRCRLVEDQHERVGAHEAAGERELLPLPVRDLDAGVPRRSELRVEPVGEAVDHVVGAGPTDGVGDRRPLVHPRLVAEPDRGHGAELEAEEVLERPGEPGAPLPRRDPREVDVVDEDRARRRCVHAATAA